MMPLRKHARIDLPPLPPEHAQAIVDALEAIVAAIWDAHGHEITDLDAWWDDQPEPTVGVDIDDIDF